MRERLRWEKELLGLYLSEHPMGEVAEQVGRYVNAYSGDLKDESLDGQRDRRRRHRDRRPDGHHQAQRHDGDRRRSRTCRAPSRWSSSRACTRRRRPTWRDGAILLVAGRVDHAARRHRSSPTSSQDWDEAAAARAGGVRPGGRRGRPRAAAADGGERPRRVGQRQRQRRAARRWSRSVPAMAAGAGRRRRRAIASRPAVAFVSPLRVDAAAPSADPGVDLGPAADRARRAGLRLRREPTAWRPLAPDRDEEPAVPDEARARIVAAATADAPLAAGPDAILHVRFAGSAASERVVSRDGAGQAAAARPSGRDPRRDPRARERGGGGATDGAAPGRRLRRRAAGRGPAPARRRARGAAPGPGLTAKSWTPRGRLRRRPGRRVSRCRRPAGLPGPTRASRGSRRGPR